MDSIKSIKQGHFLSDHCFVDSTLHVSRPVPPKKLIKFHKTPPKTSTVLNFTWTCGIAWRTKLNNYIIKLSNTTQNYMRSWISMHQSKRRESGTVTINPGSSDKIKREIVLRRKKERTWLQGQSEYSWNAFCVLCRHVANIIKMTQWNYNWVNHTWKPWWLQNYLQHCKFSLV